ncbi:MAG: hypothetical protein LCI00_31750 [Chloroflexi bacterium]|nr:hypothetical protein [Chloroflexota bacterium]MCC6893639.1 hypothetical protein [Anaerolineae bacterium]
MTRKRLKWLIGIFIVLVVTPCAGLFWLFNGRDIQIQFLLRLYPGLETVGEAYGYYGANAGLKIIYYWTPDSLNQVERYYTAFTYPFMDDPYQSNMRLTVYNVTNEELVYYDSGYRKFNYPIDNYCHYTQRYKCINVRLVDYSHSSITDLPILVSPPSWTNVKTPAPITPRDNGTLVIYSYFVSDY